MTAFLSPFLDSTGRIVACDISDAMIRKADRRSLGSTISFHQGPAEEICRRYAPFDLILCYQCFPHFLDGTRALVPFAESLGDGGPLWILYPSGREQVNAIHRNGPAVIRGHLLSPLDELGGLLEAAGFTVIQRQGYRRVVERRIGSAVFSSVSY